MPNCDSCSATDVSGLDVDEIQIPFRGNAVAVGEGLREVVAGLEKEDGDTRLELEDHVEHDDIFGLKARGDAGAAARAPDAREGSSRR